MNSTTKCIARITKYGSMDNVKTPFKIVLAGNSHFLASFPAAVDALKERKMLDRVKLVQTSLDDLPSAVQDADMLVPFMSKIDREMLMHAPKLRCVLQFGVGLEGVDIHTCNKLGILVSNMPSQLTGNATATAEHALWLTLGALRGGSKLLQHKFQNDKVLGGMPLPETVFQKNATVVGYGAVGKALCKYLHMLGANVRAIKYSPWEKNNDEDSILLGQGNSACDFSDISDVLILACPLNKSTMNLVNDNFLANLKPGCIVVNVGRGPLVNNHSILSALNAQKVKFFASDVGAGTFDAQGNLLTNIPSEPFNPSSDLALHPRTLFTPHVGGYVDVAWKKQASMLVDVVSDVAGGRFPSICVNRAAFA